MEATLEALWFTSSPLEMVDALVGATTGMVHPGLNWVRLLDLWFLRFFYTGFDQKHPLNAPLMQMGNATMGTITNEYSQFAMLSKSYRATDDRDKIYAFLGFQIVPGVVPDYDLSSESVYSSCAIRYITDCLQVARENSQHKDVREEQNSRILGLLYSAGKMNQKLLGLPSWVPDLSVELYTKPFWADIHSCCCPDKEHAIYTAGGDDKAARVEIIGNSRLRLPGKLFDVIREAGNFEFSLPPPSESATAKNLVQTLAPWLKESAHIVAHAVAIYPTYPTGENMIDAVKRTLIANRNDSATDATNEELEDIHTRLAYLIHYPDQLDAAFSQASVVPRAMEYQGLSKEVNIPYYFRPITGAAHGRVFFRTDRGYFGLGPRGIKETDCIFVVPGGCIPMVLRPMGHGLHGPEYQLLGECYVHGTMKGEVMRKAEIPVDDVILC